MSNKDTQLKVDVLVRVKSIYYMRTVVRPLLVKVGLFVVSVVSLCLLVSVPHVLENISQSQLDILTYLLNAFVATKLAVQLTLVAVAILFFLIIPDVLKNVKYLHSTRTV